MGRGLHGAWPAWGLACMGPGLQGAWPASAWGVACQRCTGRGQIDDDDDDDDDDDQHNISSCGQFGAFKNNISSFIYLIIY